MPDQEGTRMKWNLKHLRVFQEVARQGSVSRAADLCDLSQPAATQAIARLERGFPQPLFEHRRQGLSPTRAGLALLTRIDRALARLDAAATPISDQLMRRATHAQLQALVAVCETGSFSLAARRLGLAQPTVHRAVSYLEDAVPRPLFERQRTGLRATRACRALADAARLAFAELDQAEMEQAELAGRDAGQITLGALPLARASFLAPALLAFRATRPRIPLRIEDGPYDDLLSGLRRGRIDFLVGTLRDPLPVADIEQTPLFEDTPVLLVGPGHPLLSHPAPQLSDALRHPWVLDRPDTPARQMLDQILQDHPHPASLIETGSMVLMHQLLRHSDHIGFASRLQADTGTGPGGLHVLHLADLTGGARPIGLTTRRDWIPTRAQQALISAINDAATENTPEPNEI